ncbi:MULTISPECIES: zinc ribbon domain-containing protein [Mesorhizobium]|uniref:zinc ribbon domain-containing protein n=1 Tax=Mesorhizobium TaxID=68287 RepID=UPI0007EE158A|nr:MULTISPECIES: zinc ribbon domain-containing protein [Mesorhizobium]PBB51922.1 zinc ribbon domain-containing protein [Mesorhizobium loti]QIA25554.1 zinc ribbon domain-containing protein [Mesorhizobium sp. AA22]
MTPDVKDQPSLKPCPVCGRSIPTQAKRCPECHSDIEPQSASDRRRKSIVRVAEAVRDWIGFPAAVISAILAFYTPAETTIRRWLRQDVAQLSATLFNTDVINVGHDDMPAQDRVDKITEYESILRGSLNNAGFSTASLLSNFLCTGSVNEDKTRTIYTFDFFDPQSQTKQFPSVDAKGSMQFFGRLDHAMPYSDEQFATARPKSCQFGYYDKYGIRPLLVIDIDDDQLREIAGLVHEVKTAEQRDRLCADSIRGFALGGGLVADCLNGTHVSMIEPSYLWQRGVKRALTSAAAYNRQIHSTSPPRPGIILTCDPQASDCDADAVAFRATAGSLGSSLTAWFCPPDAESLAQCTKEDFPAH